MLRTFIASRSISISIWTSIAILSVSSAAFAVEPNAAPPTTTTTTTTTSPTSKAQVVALVAKVFATPYYAKQADHSRYSRMAMPPAEHRVRVTDAKPQVDATGARFVRFSIDVRYAVHQANWVKDEMTGCAYVDTNIVYAKNGSKLRRAEAYLGNKNVDDPPATACAVTVSTASR